LEKIMPGSREWLKTVVAVVNGIAVVALCSCGGGGGGTSKSAGQPVTDVPPPKLQPSTVGGTVAGLIGSGLVLENNGADDLAVSVGSDESFVFADTVAAGSSYAVSVKTQPSFPDQTCTVNLGSGVARGAAITNVSVTCVSNQTPAFVYAVNLPDGSIDSYAVDPATGSLTPLAGGAATVPAQPGLANLDSISLSADPTGTYVFAASATGTVAAYLGASATGALSPVAGSQQALSASGYPLTGVVTPDGKYLYVSSLFAGTVDAFAIDPGTGSISPVTAPGGSLSVNGAYPLALDPTGKYLFVGNFYFAGLTELSIDPNSGALAQVASLSAGIGPVSVAVDPKSRFVFVLNQVDQSVSTFAFNPATGVLTASAVTPTPGSAAPGTELSSIAVAPTGNSVYITNSTANTVSSYGVDPATGALTLTGTVPAGGTPLQIVVDRSGRFAYVGNLQGDDISVFSIDPVTGVLSAAASPAATGAAPISLVVIDH